MSFSNREEELRYLEELVRRVLEQEEKKQKCVN